MLIVPGNSENSILFSKVARAPLPPDMGQPMPLHIERLSSQEKQILRDWISKGAKDN
jgi:hypothetical protein